jgi:hypothetical protein
LRRAQRRAHGGQRQPDRVADQGGEMLVQRLNVGGMFGAVLWEGLDVQFVRFLHVLDRVDQVVEVDLTAVEGHHHPPQDGVDLRQVDPDDAFEAILHGRRLPERRQQPVHASRSPAACVRSERGGGADGEPSDARVSGQNRPTDAPDRLVDPSRLIRPLLLVGSPLQPGQELIAAFASTGEGSHRRSIACLTRSG